jgi:4-amino-4-deoxy-L-arabinose transferase-like glycosyltransferase
MSKIVSDLKSRLFRTLRRPGGPFFTPDRLGLLISLLGVIVACLVTERVFERMPHIEDEAAYVWQARVLAHGQLTIATPPHPKSYLVPFVVDLDGRRFGKYPPGWPALLAVAVKLGLRAWLNPLLAGLGVWLTYLLGKRIFRPVVGLLAAGLTVTSPFFMMNSGSLLSHPLGLALSAGFTLAWLNLFGYTLGPDRRTGCSHPPASAIHWAAAGGCLGMLVLTRPFTALAVAIPFGLHGLYLLARGSWAVRRRVLAVGLIALAFTGLYFGWQKAVTGEALKNPYVLWWPYDKIGFGEGYGVLEEGHNLKQALFNTRRSLKSGAFDLFGWGALSWIFIPYGLWAATFGERVEGGLRSIRNRPAWMLFGGCACLVIIYMAYWIGSELYGPRYYYEALFSLTLLSGAGIAFLAGWRVNPVACEGGEAQKPGAAVPSLAGQAGWLARGRAPAVMLLLAGLVAYNLAVYLPGRLQEMHGLYGANRAILDDFLGARVFQTQATQAADITPALIIVHSETWHFYGALLELEDPFLTTPYVFAWSVHPTIDGVLHNDFPFRAVYHYYEDEPGVLYKRPKE